TAARARALAASTSRFFGGADVVSDATSSRVVAAIATTARSNAAALAADGLVIPLILRTYCSAEAWISSSVAGGSKLWSVRMLRHMAPACHPGRGGQSRVALASSSAIIRLRATR